MAMESAQGALGLLAALLNTDEMEYGMMFTTMKSRWRLGAGVLGLCLLPLPSHGSSLDKAIELAVKKNQRQAGVQKSINHLSDDAADLLSEYRGYQENIDSLKRYNEQLTTLIASQEEDMRKIKDQISQVTTVGREITPLMLRMLESLERFVELDVPFLLSERQERVASLKTMMDRADVSNAEKFRRLLEAYQIENDYGRTIESYKGELPAGEGVRTVNFLRVGRSVLVYQTLDGLDSGVWDPSRREWRVLPGEYRAALSKGLRIARKQAPPDLIRLPVFTRSEVK